MARSIRFQIAAHTALQWVSGITTSGNPVLLARELAHETDTGKFKTGDGVTAWNALPYIGFWSRWGRIEGSITDQADLQAALSAHGGTVTSVAVTASNGVTASITNPTTTPVLTITLGTITPTGVNVGGASFSNSAGFTNVAQFAGVTPAMNFKNTGTGGGSFSFGIAGDGGIGFWDNGASAYRWRITSSGHFLAGADNAYSLGDSSFRWSVVYAATGAINTSDAREKSWLGAPSEAYLRAACRIGAELGLYQWLAQLNAKGSGARWHFGVRAQRVIRIFIEEGLEVEPAEGERPSFRHAFLCYDEWVEARHPIIGKRGRPLKTTRLFQRAGNRYGLRVDQLLMLLVWAQEQRLCALERQLAAPPA